MAVFASTDDILRLWRALTPAELERAAALLPVVSDVLRNEARAVGRDLDRMASDSPVYANVLRSVTVDIVARALMTSTDGEPMVQASESALGYSFSGTFLSPGGGLFVKTDELKRLGLRRQRYGALEIYGEGGAYGTVD